MFTEEQQDKADITEARSRYNARKTESNIIAWICSDGWRDVNPRNPTLRGAVYFGSACIPTNTASGEIVARQL